MHSKLYLVRLDDDTVSNEELRDRVQLMIENFPYDGNEIDYFQSMEEYASTGWPPEVPNEEKGEECRKECIKNVVDRLCSEYFAHKLDYNKVKFTRRTMEKYFSHKIDETLKFVHEFKIKEKKATLWNRFKHWMFGSKIPYKWKYDPLGFVKKSYHLLYGILNDEHPKFFSNYAYMEGEAAFIRTLYEKMDYENTDEVTMEVIDVWDYHF